MSLDAVLDPEIGRVVDLDARDACRRFRDAWRAAPYGEEPEATYRRSKGHAGRYEVLVEGHPVGWVIRCETGGRPEWGGWACAPSSLQGRQVALGPTRRRAADEVVCRVATRGFA